MKIVKPLCVSACLSLCLMTPAMSATVSGTLAPTVVPLTNGGQANIDGQQQRILICLWFRAIASPPLTVWMAV